MTRIITADEARALREAATPGPWEVQQPLDPDKLGGASGPMGGIRRQDGGRWVLDLGDYYDYNERAGSIDHEPDAAIMAAAPDLAASVERLHAQLAQAIAERDEARRVLLALADGCDDAHGVADDQIAAIRAAWIEATDAASLRECGASLRRIVGGDS